MITVTALLAALSAFLTPAILTKGAIGLAGLVLSHFVAKAGTVALVNAIIPTLVDAAEIELSNMTGAQKKAAVIEKLKGLLPVFWRYASDFIGTKIDSAAKKLPPTGGIKIAAVPVKVELPAPVTSAAAQVGAAVKTAEMVAATVTTVPAIVRQSTGEVVQHLFAPPASGSGSGIFP